MNRARKTGLRLQSSDLVFVFKIYVIKFDNFLRKIFKLFRKFVQFCRSVINFKFGTWPQSIATSPPGQKNPGWHSMHSEMQSVFWSWRNRLNIFWWNFENMIEIETILMGFEQKIIKNYFVDFGNFCEIIILKNVPSTISPLGLMLVPLQRLECHKGILPPTQFEIGQLAQHL